MSTNRHINGTPSLSKEKMKNQIGSYMKEKTHRRTEYIGEKDDFAYNGGKRGRVTVAPVNA